jgi:hypothetical protein
MELNAVILYEGHFGVFHGREDIKSFIESYLSPSLTFFGKPLVGTSRAERGEVDP